MALLLMVTLGAICALFVAQLVPAAGRVRRTLERHRARDAAQSGLAAALCRLERDAAYAGKTYVLGDAEACVTVRRVGGETHIRSVGRIPRREGTVTYTVRRSLGAATRAD
jgi:hypothetical protein